MPDELVITNAEGHRMITASRSGNLVQLAGRAHGATANPSRPPPRDLLTWPTRSSADGRCTGRPSAAGQNLGRLVADVTAAQTSTRPGTVIMLLTAIGCLE